MFNNNIVDNKQQIIYKIYTFIFSLWLCDIPLTGVVFLTLNISCRWSVVMQSITIILILNRYNIIFINYKIIYWLLLISVFGYFHSFQKIFLETLTELQKYSYFGFVNILI